MKNGKMKSPQDCLNELRERYPQLDCSGVEAAYSLLVDCYRGGGKVLCCGNGGSCADSEHIVGELMKSFLFKRPIREEIREKLADYGQLGDDLIADLEGALPAISLTGHPALTTAFLNDTNPQLTFAQQLYGLARPGDVLITLSTSGNSRNCLYAAVTARAMGVKVIALTGSGGGKLAGLADALIAVPEEETFKVQELHLPIYHCLCAMLEAEFFD